MPARYVKAFLPAPSHPIARGRAGPHLLAEILFGKYGAHLPFNRQSDIYAHEGVDLDVSTMADWVGTCVATLMPIRDAIEEHVHAAERLHVNDTTVPVLAKGQCRTDRLHLDTTPGTLEPHRAVRAWLQAQLDRNNDPRRIRVSQRLLGEALGTLVSPTSHDAYRRYMDIMLSEPTSQRRRRNRCRPDTR